MTVKDPNMIKLVKRRLLQCFQIRNSRSQRVSMTYIQLLTGNSVQLTNRMMFILRLPDPLLMLLPKEMISHLLSRSLGRRETFGQIGYPSSGGALAFPLEQVNIW
uniref:Uncharacterized protein n=1 Tax=Opuntia streptacantha TaxID=393608 RepID=A0A7C9A9R5_OPUST